MNLFPAWVSYLGYLAAVVLVIYALKLISVSDTLRKGTITAVLGVGIGVAVTSFSPLPNDASWNNQVWILLALSLGVISGVLLSRIFSMKRLVVLFNGIGSATAILVSFMELNSDPADITMTSAAVLAMIIGGVFFAGSIVVFLKMEKVAFARTVTLSDDALYALVTSIIVTIGLAVVVVVTSTVGRPPVFILILLTITSFLLGTLLISPIAYDEIPIVTSILTSFTGAGIAALGYVLDNLLLLSAGTLVFVSGHVLAKLIARTMGRKIIPEYVAEARASLAKNLRPEDEEEPDFLALDKFDNPLEKVAEKLNSAQKVMIIPGYGFALSQAQHAIQELVELLQSQGVAVSYGIHPVAGRMPGHMNVLLADANVPYEAIKEISSVNSELDLVDVALVVGASDIVNPAANNDNFPEIYGMPIFEIAKANQMVFLKRSMVPGLSGVENELLYDPKSILLLGDAKETTTELLKAVRTQQQVTV